jgi:transcriptional regulator with XRE-family HTH domain
MRQKVIPARISLALGLASVPPAEVDLRLGLLVGMVEAWELGEDEPGEDDLIALAELTGVLPEFFRSPVREAERKPTRMFLCRMGRNGKCEVVR